MGTAPTIPTRARAAEFVDATARRVTARTLVQPRKALKRPLGRHGKRPGKKSASHPPASSSRRFSCGMKKTFSGAFHLEIERNGLSDIMSSMGSVHTDYSLVERLLVGKKAVIFDMDGTIIDSIGIWPMPASVGNYPRRTLWSACRPPRRRGCRWPSSTTATPTGTVTRSNDWRMCFSIGKGKFSDDGR